MNGNIYIPLFEVFRRYKRHGLDDSISQLVPNLNLDFSTLFVGSAGNVTHGDVFAEGRRRDTRSDHTYFFYFFLFLSVNEMGHPTFRPVKDGFGGTTDQFAFHPTHQRLYNLLSLGNPRPQSRPFAWKVRLQVPRGFLIFQGKQVERRVRACFCLLRMMMMTSVSI